MAVENVEPGKIPEVSPGKPITDEQVAVAIDEITRDLSPSMVPPALPELIGPVIVNKAAEQKGRSE